MLVVGEKVQLDRMGKFKRAIAQHGDYNQLNVYYLMKNSVLMVHKKQIRMWRQGIRLIYSFSLYIYNDIYVHTKH